MIPARIATYAHAQDFMANDEFLLPILKAQHNAFAHNTLLEMLDVFSLCVAVQMSVDPAQSTPVVPSAASRPRTAPDMPILP
jgi:hypothetical protein